MEIEQLAAERPEALAKVPVDAMDGVDRATAEQIAAAAKFPADLIEPVAGVLIKLWETFIGTDATLVEVNPLARVGDGNVVALDGKVTLDDNATFRQPRNAELEDVEAATRSSARPRRSTSTTSSSTERLASSATAPGWSCQLSTSWPTPARSTAGSSRRTSLISAVAHPPR